METVNNLTITQSFFLAALRDHIHRRVTDVCPEPDWEQLCLYARNHQLSGIVGCQCREYLNAHTDEKACAELLSGFYGSVYASKKRDKAYLDIKNAFLKEEIVFFPVKGQSVSAFYPVPALRVMGDVDIVMSAEDRLKAHEIMRQLGYSNTVHDDAEWTYIKDGIEIELHDKLEYEQLTEFNLYFNDFWKYVRTENGEYRLDPNFHFLYLLLHLRKHLISFGVGFRQFMDIALMTEAEKKVLDWQWITRELEKIKLLGFARQCAELCRMWFGVDIPIAGEPIAPEFYIKATESVFANGVFGFQNEDNADVSINQIAKSAALSQTDLQKTVLRKTVRNIFPDYHTMCSAEHYSFLRGRPYLLPSAWVYRLWRGITLRKMHFVTKMADDVRTSTVMSDEIQARADYLKQWKI